ncbi:hypothetical protein GRI58_01635 [Porphyrobacter algicida]|uniref:Deacetylase PdaC domain-containing protein n=1 Tax=Qipengyuania algicida TaxID=1836209 RepID=A0A845AEY8_9SPHN|nr:DUF4163 domain-containing protein [Qipengyuania algicida]MXP27521.1 hypothetical protein [Qipengyuania algicida]
MKKQTAVAPDHGRSVAAQATASAVKQAAADAKPVDFTDNETAPGKVEGSRRFSYSWPAAVSAIPKLAALLTRERDKALASQKAQWNQALASTPDDCASCRSFGTKNEWQVVADLPQWLSLSDLAYVYSGGAHGMTGLSSLVWDKRVGRAVTGKEMFRSPGALERALGPTLCEKLDKARAKKRGEPIPKPSGSDDFLNGCPHLDEATILPGSSGGEKFDRIGIWFGPYVAGPYAEGSYELTFPVDSAIIDAVKPEYASAFTISR